MPTYSYRCRSGHNFTRYDSVANHCSVRLCPTCFAASTQIITAPLMVKVAQDVCYDSPIDGRAITSQDARQEDMKRANCVPYDPDRKTDAANQRKAEDAALDTMIEAHAEEVTEKMTTAQRGKIYSEIVDQGTTAEIVRRSP